MEFQITYCTYQWGNWWDYSGIPQKFQWNSGRISKKNSPQKLLEYCSDSTGKFWQISQPSPTGIPIAFWQNSTGTPAEYHWNSAGLSSEETGKILADIQRKALRKSSGIPLKFHQKIWTNFPAESKWNSNGIPPEYQCYYDGIRTFWHSGAFFPWVKNLEAEIHCHAPSK